MHMASCELLASLTATRPAEPDHFRHIGIKSVECDLEAARYAAQQAGWRCFGVGQAYTCAVHTPNNWMHSVWTPPSSRQPSRS